MAAAVFLTDLATVKRRGALIWQLFEDDTGDVDLDNEINELIEVHDAWLYSRLDPLIYASTDSRIQVRLKNGEAYLVLADLVGELAARKVFGTHQPYVSEDSASYIGPDGLATYFRQRANELLDEYIVTEEPGKVFALPYFGISADVDFTTLESQSQQVADELDLARGFPIPIIDPVGSGT